MKERIKSDKNSEIDKKISNPFPGVKTIKVEKKKYRLSLPYWVIYSSTAGERNWPIHVDRMNSWYILHIIHYTLVKREIMVDHYIGYI